MLGLTVLTKVSALVIAGGAPLAALALAPALRPGGRAPWGRLLGAYAVATAVFGAVLLHPQGAVLYGGTTDRYAFSPTDLLTVPWRAWGANLRHLAEGLAGYLPAPLWAVYVAGLALPLVTRDRRDAVLVAWCVLLLGSILLLDKVFYFRYYVPGAVAGLLPAARVLGLGAGTAGALGRAAGKSGGVAGPAGRLAGALLLAAVAVPSLRLQWQLGHDPYGAALPGDRVGDREQYVLSRNAGWETDRLVDFLRGQARGSRSWSWSARSPGTCAPGWRPGSCTSPGCTSCCATPAGRPPRRSSPSPRRTRSAAWRSAAAPSTSPRRSGRARRTSSPTSRTTATPPSWSPTTPGATSPGGTASTGCSSPASSTACASPGRPSSGPPGRSPSWATTSSSPARPPAARPGSVTLYWQARQPPGRSYTVFVHAVAPGPGRPARGAARRRPRRRRRADRPLAPRRDRPRPAPPRPARGPGVGRLLRAPGRLVRAGHAAPPPRRGRDGQVPHDLGRGRAGVRGRPRVRPVGPRAPSPPIHPSGAGARSVGDRPTRHPSTGKSAAVRRRAGRRACPGSRTRLGATRSAGAPTDGVANADAPARRRRRRRRRPAPARRVAQPSRRQPTSRRCSHPTALPASGRGRPGAGQTSPPGVPGLEEFRWGVDRLRRWAPSAAVFLLDRCSGSRCRRRR